MRLQVSWLVVPLARGHSFWSASGHDVDLQVMRTLGFSFGRELLEVGPMQTLDVRPSPYAQDGNARRYGEVRRAPGEENALAAEMER